MEVRTAVTIIDAPCGAGKTSWAIQYMNANKGKSFVYCTPFLDEIKRIRESCGWDRFKEPMPYTDGSKLTEFNTLLAKGECIAVTHSTFLNATDETLHAIAENDYELILDEALDVVKPFNDIQSVAASPKQSVSKADIDWLIECRHISIATDFRVSWCGGATEADFKFSEVRRLAELERLYCVNRTFLVGIYPPKVFQAFKQVYALTYYFKGYSLKSYFDMFNIKYEYASVINDDGGYKIIPYDPSIDLTFRAKCAELITVCDNDRLNPPRALSKRWFDKADESDIATLKKHIASYFSHLEPKPMAKDIGWTVFQEYQAKLKGKGYTRVRNVSKSEQIGLSTGELDRLESETSCFIACNSRATNMYRNRWALAYLINLRQNPYIKDLFVNAGVRYVEDDYSIANLLQWLCRSRLRDGLPINLYLPSARMRKLLSDFTGGVSKTI